MKSYVNTLLDNDARVIYTPIIDEMKLLCPETFTRKIPEANVQQAFVYDYIYNLLMQYYYNAPDVLGVGCFEDTAYESLVKLSFPVVGIDPATNGETLESFFGRTNNKFDIVFSTSVIEHVPNDENFLDKICKLLKPGGFGILTTDFKNSWKPGEPVPYSNERLYTEYDLEFRLRKIIEANNCHYINEPCWTGDPDFWYQGHTYSFATIIFRKDKE